MAKEENLIYKRNELYSPGQGKYINDILPTVTPAQEETVIITDVTDPVEVPYLSVLIYQEGDGVVDIYDEGDDPATDDPVVQIPVAPGDYRYIPLKDGGIVVVPAGGYVDASAGTSAFLRLIPIAE